VSHVEAKILEFITPHAPLTVLGLWAARGKTKVFDTCSHGAKTDLRLPS